MIITTFTTFLKKLHKNLKEKRKAIKFCYNSFRYIKVLEIIMQTLTIEVKDGFMTEFMKLIDTVKDNVVVHKDKNLELDPYFYERQKELQQIRDDIKSGKAEMLTQEQYDNEMEKFFEKLEKEEHAN